MEFLVRKCRTCGTQYPADFDELCEVDFEDSWAFWCQKHDKPADTRGCEQCAYKFVGKLHFNAKELGESLFANWAIGKRDAARRKVSDWLSESGRDRILSGKIREIERLETLSPDDRYAVIVMLLHDDQTLRWREMTITLSSFHQNKPTAIELLRGPLPKLLADLGLGTWLRDLRDHWKTIADELPIMSDQDSLAFDLLFSTSVVKDLGTALTVAALIPRLHLPSMWDAKSGKLAAMAAAVDDTGFKLPDRMRLKQLFGGICRGLKTGTLPLLTNSDFFDSTLLLAWAFEGKSLLENESFRYALTSHLQINQDPRLLKSLVFGYLRDFTLEKPEFVNLLASTIRWYLTLASLADFRKWISIDSQFHLFAGTQTPSACAERMELTGDIETQLKSIGLSGTSLWSGLSTEILLRKIALLGAFSLDEWPLIATWFEKCHETLTHREHEWVNSIIAAYHGKPATGDIRKSVSRYLVDRFGEPDETAPVWCQCHKSVRDTVVQWLLFENLEKFFEVIADYAETTGGEMRSQWGFRKAFWLAVHRTGAVADLRIAAGRGLMETLGESKLKDRFGSKLVKLNDSDERRCALVLRLGPLTVVDFTHNAKCRIWQTGEEQENWFKGAKLTKFTFQGGTDLRIRSHYETTGIAHFSSETYGWQDAVAEFLKRYLPAGSLRHSSYEYRG